MLPQLISREAVRSLEVRGAERGGGAALAARAPGRRRERQALYSLLKHTRTPCTQAELDNGISIAALRRFNDNLRALPADQWGARPRGARGVGGGTTKLQARRAGQAP